MKSKVPLLLIIGVLLLFSASCASNRSTRAMRRAEKMMRQQAVQAQKQYDDAKNAHYRHQAPMTKKMIRENKRRAERFNRHLRR